MTRSVSTTSPIWIAMDIAKAQHQVLIELQPHQRKVVRVPNTRAGIDSFIATLRGFERRCVIAFEPTGDYHRPVAYWLGHAGRPASGVLVGGGADT